MSDISKAAIIKGREVAEWANAAASKAVLPLILASGFESFPLRRLVACAGLVCMGNPFSEILVSAALVRTLVAVVSTVQVRLAGVA